MSRPVPSSECKCSQLLSANCSATCEEGPGQLFDTGPPSTVGVIRVKGTNLCVDAGDCEFLPQTAALTDVDNCKANGVKLTLQNCGEGAWGAQEWWQSTNGRIELAGPVTHAHQAPPRSGFCFDLTNGNEASGSVQIWQCYDNNPNQRWDLGPWCRFC